MGWIDLEDGAFSVSVSSLALGEDSDGDGIPDAWEFLHAGNLNTFTAKSDTDQDGITDLEEYLADTDPFDPTEYLRVVAWQVSV